MKIYIVIGYDSIFDSEEIRGVWQDRELAELYLANYGGCRIEEHDIADMKVEKGEGRSE